MSTPNELNNLVNRVGLEEAMRLVRAWIGQQDARIFLAAGGGGARAAPEGIPPPAWRRENDESSLSQPYPLQRVGGLSATSSAGGGAGLGATSSASGGRTILNPEDEEPPAPGTEDEPRVSDCELHGPMQGGGLWYAPNSMGYSTFSPPCNGCRDGQRDRANGLWMSGFGSSRNVFHSDGTGPMRPLYPVPGSPAPLAAGGGGAALCATASGGGDLSPTPSGGLAATSSAWESGGAALGPTPSGGGGLLATASGEDWPAIDNRQFSRLQTVMLDCLREAEAEPTAQWRIDNLVNAMERFREAGGADGDNYRYCQQRLAELERERPRG